MDEAEIGREKDNDNDSIIDDVGSTNNNIIANASKDNAGIKKNSDNKKIEKKDINKEKRGVLNEEVDDIPLSVFFRRVFRILIFLVVWVLPSYLGGRYILHLWDKWYYTGEAQGWSWKPFLIIQFITTRITYYVSKLFSIPVELDKVTGLAYPKPLNTLIIIPDCTGILEMIFITALLMGIVMGFRLRMNILKRLKWAGILCGILYIENIIRLVLNWPIAKAYGFDTWSDVHMWWWKQGQLMFVMLLFSVWFIKVGKKYLPLSENSQDNNSRLNTSSNSEKTKRKSTSK